MHELPQSQKVHVKAMIDDFVNRYLNAELLRAFEADQGENQLSLAIGQNFLNVKFFLTFGAIAGQFMPVRFWLFLGFCSDFIQFFLIHLHPPFWLV